jgi:hypothetical protein
MSPLKPKTDVGIGIGLGAVTSGILVTLCPGSMAGVALIFSGLAVTVIWFVLCRVTEGVRA